MKKKLNYYGIARSRGNWQKLLLTMKITVFLFFCGLVNLIAAPGYSQNTKISLSMEDASIESILNRIEESSEFYFLFNHKLIDVDRKVNVIAENKPIKDILDDIFNDDVRFIVSDRQIVLTPNQQTSSDFEELLQQKTITGRVIDASTGDPMPGVNIVIKGTSIGTATDLNGNFSLFIPSEKSILVISFIGYITQEVVVGNRLTLEVNLEVESMTLDEVVVTALGISKEKKSLSYNVAVVQGEEITKTKEINLGNSLIGRVAGVNATSTATGPGGSSRVLVRGNTSISGNNQPLYVVNGIPINIESKGQATGSYGGYERGDGLNSINPDDIESISVLKGGAASALYGSRASNGVILITTKSGTIRKGLGVEFNSLFSLQSLGVKPDYQYEFGSGTRGLKPANQGEAIQYGRTSWGAKLDGSMVINPDGVARPYVAHKENFKNFYTEGFGFSNSLAFSGGSEVARFRFSVSDLTNNSIVPNFSFKRNVFDLSVDANISKKIIFRGNAQYNFESGGNRPGLNDFTSNPNASLYVMATSLDVRTLAPGYDEDGYETAWNDLTFAINPYFATEKRDASDKTRRFIGSFSTQYNITDYLFAKVEAGIDTDNFEARDVTPTGSLTNVLGSMSESRSTFSEINLNALLGFIKRYGQFSLDIFVGGSQMHQQSKSDSWSSGNFNVPFNYFIRNGVSPNFSNSVSELAINSLYGSSNIGFKNYLYLTVTGRQDYFSTLSLESNHIFYPSVGLSFLFSEIIKPSWLDLGKVRASWAQVGGGAPNPYSLNLTYTAQSVSHLGVPMMAIGTSRVPNSALKPYTSTTSEIGLELSMFKNKLRFDGSLYNQITTDDIVAVNIPNSSGYTSTLINIGKVRNRGIELLVTVLPIERKNGFTWELSYNFSYNHNTVVKISDEMDRMSVGAPPRSLNGFVYHFEGQPYGMLAGYKFKVDDNNNYVYDRSSGLPMQSDLEILGKGVPPVISSIRNNFSYKNLSMGFLVDGKFGGSLYSGTNANATFFGLHKNTIENNVRETGIELIGVDNDGDEFSRTLPAQDYYQGIALKITNEYIYNADFIKLREIYLGYSIPNEITSKVRATSANISLFARNLLFFLRNVPNIDPESAYNSSNSQGLDSFGIPPTRSYGISLNIAF